MIYLYFLFEFEASDPNATLKVKITHTVLRPIDTPFIVMARIDRSLCDPVNRLAFYLHFYLLFRLRNVN